MLALSFLVKLEPTEVDWLDVMGTIEGPFVLSEGGKQSWIPYNRVFLRPHSATVVKVLHKRCVLRGMPSQQK